MAIQVLHTHWVAPSMPGDEGCLFVWAETAACPQPSRDRRKKAAQPHPFALTTHELAARLMPLVSDDGPGAGPDPASRRHPGVKSSKLTLWLPTNRFGPCPSPELLHDWDTDDGPLELLPWTIPGMPLSAGDAFRFLIEPGGTRQLGIRMGGDWRYWRLAAHLALEILARQQLRPTLIESRAGRNVRYEARWLPVLDNEQDARRLALLARGMPPVCRAEVLGSNGTADPATADPGATIPPGALLESFLNHMTDAGARWWGADRAIPSTVDDGPTTEWLRALFRDDPVPAGSAGQMQHLYSSFRAWERALHIAGNKQYRVAFRLEAPVQRAAAQPAEKADAGWRLHYLLQARDDASLIVPAAEVWKTRGGVLRALDRRFDQPQERLLTGLGYAARFFSPFRRSLETPHPTGITLTGEEAYEFLRHCAPRLEQSGFGLLVPPWWNKPNTRLGVRLKLARGSGLSAPAAVSSGHMSLDNLVSFHWELSLGGSTLTLQEFQALVALKSPLVQIRGQWVQLDPDQIEAAIRFWEQEQALEGEISPAEALRLGLDSATSRNGLPIDGVEMDAWLEGRLGRLRGDEQLQLLPTPAGLRARLRPYQHYGYSWLDFARRWGIGAILADDMGLGKTVQTLTMLLRLKEELGGLPAPTLLICPTSVVANWQQEIERFTPALRALVHQGGGRLQGEAFAAAALETDMVLTSYALARRDEEALAAVEWLGVVLDEAQNIKNPNTRQAGVIRRLPAQFRLALTGTPMENRLLELWSIMHFLNPGFLGSRDAFRRRFAVPIEQYGDDEAAGRLRRLTGPFILRRLKTDPTVIQDLPEKQEMKVYCTLSEEQVTLYQAVVENALGEIATQEEDDIARKGLVLSMLMQLKQVCNHPVQYLHQTAAYDPLEDSRRSGKLRRFHAILDEVLAEGDRLLVFSQFTEMGELIRRSIQERFGVQALFLHGGTPAKKRPALVERFQAEDGPPVFILSLKAGGTGLNLTRANHVFHFDRWWNPAVEDQATDRAFRIGQSRNVLVHKFVCLGTLEERIDQMITEKKALAERIIGVGESWLTEMSTADLRALVQLRRESL